MGSMWAFGDFYPTIKVTRRRQNRVAITCFFQTKELTKSQFILSIFCGSVRPSPLNLLRQNGVHTGITKALIVAAILP